MKKTKEQISYNMSRVKNKDSQIENLLRKELWRRGLRYRKNSNKVFGHPDILNGRDINTECESVCVFSIQPHIGKPLTLLNASHSTNFIFEVSGISKEKAEEINGINTRSKIKDRVREILKTGSLRFVKAENDCFAGNLMLIDTLMDKIIAELLLNFYSGTAGDCKSLIEKTEADDPLGFGRSGIYAYKMKKLLSSLALGMVPSIEWDGQINVNRRYVIVNNYGNVLAHSTYDRSLFEDYLLNCTKFDIPPTSWHKFASIYEEKDGRMYIKLNLQIRFKKHNESRELLQRQLRY